MQLSWAILEYDAALWKNLNDRDWSSGIIILLITSYYFGAILGNLFGAVMVLHLRKKLIYVCVIVDGLYLSPFNLKYV